MKKVIGILIVLAIVVAGIMLAPEIGNAIEKKVEFESGKAAYEMITGKKMDAKTQQLYEDYGIAAVMAIEAYENYHVENFGKHTDWEIIHCSNGSVVMKLWLVDNPNAIMQMNIDTFIQSY